ncbi:hypothetical protein BYI23_A001740 [Burkholderia sp. YI23]|nr:hypothetical protein BYI23_A001740 [Burkholderia sp. YI23]
MNPEKVPESTQLSVRLYRPDGSVQATLNFKSLRLSYPLRDALYRGFLAVFGHTSTSSQRATFLQVAKFAQFLNDSELSLAVPLPWDTLPRFRRWLAWSRLNSTSAGSVLNTITALLAYCERSCPNILAADVRLKIEKFRPAPVRHYEALSEEAVKIILKCCHRDIEEIEERLAPTSVMRANFRAAWATVEGGEGGDADLIKTLLLLGNGFPPTLDVIAASKGNLKRMVGNLGGLRKLYRRLVPFYDDIFPFYLAVLIQTSGNPASIKNINRDCIRQHPLRDDLERVVWDKPRARREQRVEMPINRPWSAANIIRRLCALNECVIPMYVQRDREKAFLAFRFTRREIAIPELSGFERLKDAFEKRHGLPNFTLSSVRRAGAIAHYRARNRIADAQMRLDHQSLQTTSLYLDGNQVGDAHDEVIHHYQGLLMRACLKSDCATSSSSVTGEGERYAETVFGFTCADPFAGLAEGSQRGSRCLQFQKCATCPGAVIPLDDPTIVARLLTAYSALEDARARALQEGWMPRFDKLYETTVRVLKNDILPAITDAVRQLAERKVDKRRIPRLE